MDYIQMVSLAHEAAVWNAQVCRDSRTVVNQIVTDPEESGKFLIAEGSDDVQSSDEEIVVRDRLDNSLTDSKYIIIRHANSSFNYMMSNLPEQGVQFQIDGEIHPKEIAAVTNLDHLDAKLSELGVL